MLADQQPGRLAHRLNVVRQVVLPNPTLPQSGALRTVEQQVAIAATTRTEPGVEFAGDRMCPAHCHRIGQMRVHAAHPGRQRPHDSSFEMDDLMRRMDAGIGTTGADDAERRAGNLAQCSLESILYGRPPGLALPAAKRRAAVLHAQGNSRLSQRFTPMQSTAMKDRARPRRSCSRPAATATPRRAAFRQPRQHPDCRPACCATRLSAPRPADFA